MPDKEILDSSRVRCLCCVERGVQPKHAEMNSGSWNKHHKTMHASCTHDECAPPPQQLLVRYDYVDKMADLQTQAIFSRFVVCFFSI
jgi:hypothetical protein